MHGLNWEGGEVEHKYKVGDRVRVVKEAWGKTFPVGEFGKVTNVLGHGVCAAREGGDGYGWFFSWSQVEPAPAEQVQGGTASGRFRVGDRVRLLEDNEGGEYGRRGDTGVISWDLSGGSHLVNFDTFRKNGDGRWYVKIDNLTPAFSPGDRVKLNRHSDLYACGDRGTVKRVFGGNVEVRMDVRSVFASRSNVFPAEYLDGVRVEDCARRKIELPPDTDVESMFINGTLYTKGFTPCPQDNEQHEYHETFARLKDSVVAPQPAIVARVDNGQPLPTMRPFIHGSVAGATQEAERLARNNPGQEFAVYQRVTARVCAVSYEMKEVA
jgi:hypothetical protein